MPSPTPRTRMSEGRPAEQGAIDHRDAMRRTSVVVAVADAPVCPVCSRRECLCNWTINLAAEATSRPPSVAAVALAGFSPGAPAPARCRHSTAAGQPSREVTPRANESARAQEKTPGDWSGTFHPPFGGVRR